MKSSKSLWKPLGAGLTAFILSFLLSACSASLPDKVIDLTSDKQMQDYFSAHEGDFEALLNVALQDPNNNMMIALKSPAADNYRALMQKLGATWIFNGKKQGIAITSEHWGLESKGIVLAYKWMPQPPPVEEMVKSLDELIDGSQSFTNENKVFLKYRLLTGQWYLVFQWSPPSNNQ